MPTQKEIEIASSRARELLFYSQQILAAAHSTADQNQVAGHASVFLEILSDKLHAHVAAIEAARKCVELANVESPIVSIAGCSGATAHEVAGKLAAGVLNTARHAFIAESGSRFGHRFPDARYVGGLGWTKLIPDDKQSSPAIELFPDSIIAALGPTKVIAGYWIPIRASLQRIPLFDWQPWDAHVRKESQRALAKISRGKERSDLPERADRLAELPNEAMMNHVDLASYLTLEAEALRKRLDRWRGENDGWQEVHESSSREPKYVYRIGAIRGLLQAAIASVESSA